MEDACSDKGYVLPSDSTLGITPKDSKYANVFLGVICSNTGLTK